MVRWHVDIVRSITTDANETVGDLHDRMLVIVEPPDWPAWLGKIKGEPAGLLANQSPECGSER